MISLLYLSANYGGNSLYHALFHNNKLEGEQEEVVVVVTKAKDVRNGNNNKNSTAVKYRQNGRIHPPPEDERRKSQAIDISLESIMSEFHLSNDTLARMMAQMDRRMTQGLEGAGKSTISMLPSFVPSLSDGSEKGRFLAMDLGGTNLRVLLLEIENGRLEGTSQRNYRMTDHVMTGKGTDLFDFMIGKLSDFLEEKELSKDNLPLGFTFSYPCSQTSLTSAKLMRWTKGFNASGVEGNDVVKLMEEAIERNGKIQVKVQALMNDTVGTQVATAFEYGSCHLGAIVATGTNCSYMEHTDRIPKIRDLGYPYPKMIINTEWGGFGDNGEAEYIRTTYDRIVDQNSVHPGVQSFDKLVAGMYMGEVCRLVLVELAERDLLFAGVSCLGDTLLVDPLMFPTKFISEILGDDSSRIEGGRSHPATRQILEELGLEDGYTFADILLLREVCVVVSRRSALLAASAIACVIKRTGEKKVTVGIDGSTYRYHPFFHVWVRDKLKDLLGDSVQVNLVQAGDGSGKGAALVAAISHRLENAK